jgi:hypothetical protein
VGCTSLQLKLLSLQGDKSTCTIQQLHLQQEPDPQALCPAAASTEDSEGSQQHENTAAGADADASASAVSSMPRQQALSQLDELRLLIQQLHQPGEDRCKDTAWQAAPGCALCSMHGSHCLCALIGYPCHAARFVVTWCQQHTCASSWMTQHDPACLPLCQHAPAPATRC